MYYKNERFPVCRRFTLLVQQSSPTQSSTSVQPVHYPFVIHYIISYITHVILSLFNYTSCTWVTDFCTTENRSKVLQRSALSGNQRYNANCQIYLS